MYPGHPDYNYMDDHVIHFAIKIKVSTWPYERRRSLCGNDDMKLAREDGSLEICHGMAQRSFSVDNINCVGCLSELFLLSNEAVT
jgi:hypothetical protein